MSDQKITLALGRDVLTRAQATARRNGCALEDVLAEWLDRYANELPVDSLTDDEVLHLCDLEMNLLERQELSVLLAHHRVRDLADDERRRLNDLIHLHRRVLVRKAQAIQVAFLRGLRDADS